MTPDEFDTLLDQCMTRLQQGESVDRILKSFPGQAARLRPLLEVAARMYTLPAPKARPTAYTAARHRMLEAIELQKNTPRPSIWQRIQGISFPVFPNMAQLFGNFTNVALLAILIIALAWIFASFDLDPDPAGEQIPTLTPTRTSIVSPTPTTLSEIATQAFIIPTATSTFTVSATSSATLTQTPTTTSQPVFIISTPTPTEQEEEEDEPTETPFPSPVPTETSTPTSTLPPYPFPITDTPSPSPTSTEEFQQTLTLTPTGTELALTLTPTP